MANLLFIRPMTMLRGVSKLNADSSTEQKIFHCQFDAKPADRDEVLLAVGIGRGAPFKAGDPRLADQLGVACYADDVRQYIVTIDYKTPDGDDGSGSGTTNPLLRADKLSIRGTSSEKPYFVDYDPEGPFYVMSSAGEVFKNLPKNRVGDFVITVAGNRGTIDAATWPSYLKPACATNAAAVTIKGITFAAHTLLMLDMGMEEATESGVSFYEMSWSMAVNSEGWDEEKYDDRGTYEITDDTLGIIEPILEDNGVDQVSTPYPLDGEGHAKQFLSDDPATITFKPQPVKDFGVFGFTA